MATEETTFHAAIAAQITGFNINTLRDLRNRSSLLIEGQGAGWTRYTFHDLIALACVSVARHHGFSVEGAARIANYAVKRYRRAVLPSSIEMPGQIVAVQHTEDGCEGLVSIHDIAHADSALDRVQDLLEDFLLTRVCVLDLTALERTLNNRIRAFRGPR